VGFKALRADAQAEFLASSDIWFRPVQMANGPDGALYVLDMYRHLIQAADFLPPAIVKHLDVGGGFDKGRLYRVVPRGFQRPRTPRLSLASTAELVALLEHPNGWHRDTASRLLYQRQDRSAITPLKALAAEVKSPLGRMHSLYALAGLQALDSSQVLRGLDDADPRVREHAVRLAEAFETDAGICARLEQMTDDPDFRVRYQLAFSLGCLSGESPTRALVRLARRDGSDSWFRLAILSSCRDRARGVFESLLGDKDYRVMAEGRPLLSALVSLMGSASRAAEVAAVCRTLNDLPASEQDLKRDLARTLFTTLPQGRDDFALQAGPKELWDEVMNDALRVAPDTQRAVNDRVTAIRLLGLVPLAERENLFRDLMQSQQPQPVQAAAVEALGRINQPEASALLLEAWHGLSPQLRASATEMLFSRPGWIADLLDGLEQGKLNRADVDPVRLQSLAKHKDVRLRSRAADLLAASGLARRADVVAAYQAALELKGDAVRGKAVFQKQCSACHQLEGVGYQAGVDLHAVGDQGREAVLLNILDPNREVKPPFQVYAVVTDGGLTISGMITAETANSLSIRRADGTTETILRIHIAELRSTGLSFMPEGLEQQIGIPDMADLLAYLASIR
jgi:putative heme-binding domain-containing protein